MDKKQMEKEIEDIKKGLKDFAESKSDLPSEVSSATLSSVSALMKYLVDERERTNRILEGITQRIKVLEEDMSAIDISGQVQDEYGIANNREIPLSSVDAKVINFVQTKNMACAEEVRDFMKYKGNNAACARLNRLHKIGLLDRLQLGHKVYYKYDAGKATNTLIVSPPQ